MAAHESQKYIYRGYRINKDRLSKKLRSLYETFPAYAKDIRLFYIEQQKEKG